MAELRRKDGLGIIFAFFLGLMVTAFVGVGVYTFYQPPQRDTQTLEALSDQSAAIRDSRPNSELTEAEKAELDALNKQASEIFEAHNLAQQAWIQTSSIILVIFATLIMAVSLIAAEKLSLISNGLLLGGVFTMLYGVGWTIASHNTIIRFIVIAVALAITLALGYVRFVRNRSMVSVERTGQSGSSVGTADLTDIEQRLCALEQRINEAAAVLGK